MYLQSFISQSQKKNPLSYKLTALLITILLYHTKKKKKTLFNIKKKTIGEFRFDFKLYSVLIKYKIL